jgi:hypothetical protein
VKCYENALTNGVLKIAQMKLGVLHMSLRQNGGGSLTLRKLRSGHRLSTNILAERIIWCKGLMENYGFQITLHILLGFKGQLYSTVNDV